MVSFSSILSDLLLAFQHSLQHNSDAYILQYYDGLVF